jgi:hypothetical protein
LEALEHNFKIGDVLKFQTSNLVVYGIFLRCYYQTINLGEGTNEGGYYVFSIIPFDTGRPENFYESEFLHNLMGE